MAVRQLQTSVFVHAHRHDFGPGDRISGHSNGEETARTTLTAPGRRHHSLPRHDGPVSFDTMRALCILQLSCRVNGSVPEWLNESKLEGKS